MVSKETNRWNNVSRKLVLLSAVLSSRAPPLGGWDERTADFSDYGTFYVLKIKTIFDSF